MALCNEIKLIIFIIRILTLVHFQLWAEFIAQTPQHDVPASRWWRTAHG